jgi:hypothetical protein
LQGLPFSRQVCLRKEAEADPLAEFAGPCARLHRFAAVALGL